MKTVLTIAGFDPSGGAGIMADLKVFSDFGVSGVSVITALTAQNSKRVEAVWPVPSDFVRKECEALLEDMKLSAVKIGMLATGQTVRTIRKLIEGYRLKNIVLDPLFVSTSGYPLLAQSAIKEMKKLIPLADVLTPNLSEAALLTGLDVQTPADRESAAR
ncbi:MAG: hydroxymethylpyrimidine/phosphomethylpyrimidine kinase, partial [Deltaproteobacteria bacterium]|nr:hydroxymethylpyrimidine/phosphomethylpyrimidine kinase [Deltaproteobacteria bacterium]